MQVKELLTAILFHRLMREVDVKAQDLIRRACVPRYITQNVLPVLWGDDREGAGSRGLLWRLLKYSFVDPGAEQTDERRWVIHSRVRELVLTSISDWVGLKGLHGRLAEYYQSTAAAEQDPERQFALELEAVLHALQANEEKGMDLFVDTAHEVSRRFSTERLRRLLSEAATIPLKDAS